MSVAEKAKGIDRLIEDAKWNMYGEQWGTAISRLEEARRRAIAIKDKGRIDKILDLLKHCSNKEKVELT